jgi:hypothetical protein
MRQERFNYNVRVGEVEMTMQATVILKAQRVD